MLRNQKLLKYKRQVDKIKGKFRKPQAELPELNTLEDVWIMDIFSVLNGQRHAGDVPLSLSDIHAYMEISAIEQYERTFLLHMLLELDNEYMEYVSEINKKEARKTKGKR
jgi:hypothetical protein